MENWEFLLQKQGDKSWLPLESPTVEILEGHYRLASRTKLANVLVGIQLSYIPSSDLQIPSRQKFSKRIDSEGLLIVMPYTHFTAGTWQIECINLEQEPQKSSLRSAIVCFEVQPISADLASDWQLNFPQIDTQIDTSIDLRESGAGLSDRHSITSQKTKDFEEIGSEIKQIETETESEGLAGEAEPVAKQSKVYNSESDLVSASDSISLAEPDRLNDRSGDAGTIGLETSTLPLNLIVLHQSQYLVSETQFPILSGISYLPGELEVILKSPQNLEIVMYSRFALEPPKASNAPIEFSFELQIPAHTSQVTIGEVRLHPSPDLSLIDDRTHIYYQAIAITFQSQNILSETARELTTAAQPQPLEALPNAGADAIASKSTNSTDSISNVPSTKSLQLPLKANSDRPVNKHLATKLDKSTKLPELPKISPLPKMHSGDGQRDRDLDDSDMRREQLSELDRDENILELGQYELAGSAEKVSAELPSAPEVDPKSRDILKSLQTNDSFLDKLRSLTKESIAESLLSQKVSELIEAEVGKLESEIEQSLDLEDLDLEDLGSEFEQMLLNDELLAVQDLDREPSGDEPVSERVTSPIATETEAAVDLGNAPPTDLSNCASDPNEPEDEPHYSEQELVAIEALQEVVAASEAINKSAASDRQVLPTWPANEPVPAPILEIPESEAIAGFPLPVLVKLPIVQSKLFVKLWVKDCQTRNIIDGPRWLVDFQWGSDPDYLTLSTTITLPLDVMEVMFEAITIEMQTQRESRKTSIPRSVTPPNLSLDEELDFDPPSN
ncbi:hypothetical protein [Pseudanabaena sp. PCC 6802]|uniref:hypothetical protein n=1 Tax=Pseudanabaena sp. PCC 6802 TaxID=118173 RepID=UPI00034A4C65|nr:hypothetical protein [Pseudanabaena sp. PCC 6802]